VTEGIGRVQSRGEKITELHPGDTVWTPPGEWHWHGAAPGQFMTHLAMWESLAEGQEGPETSWGDLVTDEEYNA
jgi:quercetin dioxygenase-like cupin family protein